MQHSTLPPNHKVFLLYMSYLFPPDDSDPANRPRPLQGPLNDAEEMKTALTGGAYNNVCFTAFSPFKSVVATVLYSYREEDIFTMTDEKKNAGTKQWPSKQNIVSFSPSQGAHGCISTNTGKFNERSCGPW